MKTVLITRPPGQAAQLAELIRVALPAVHVLQIPLLTILPNEDPREAERLREQLKKTDLAVIVSPNAVECGMRMLAGSWPKEVPIAIVGMGSQRALLHHGINQASGYQIIAPQGQEDSEGLWAALQALKWPMQDQQVLFLKGVGGRVWLGEQFVMHGAHVYPINAYQRVTLSSEASLWDKLATLEPSQTCCLMTSSEAARHWAQVLQKKPWGAPWFEQVQMIASHPRIMAAIEDLGFRKVSLAGSGDEAILAATSAWYKNDSLS